MTKPPRCVAAAAHLFFGSVFSLLSHLEDAAACQQARSDLLSFATRLTSKYETPKHIRFLGEKLQAAERGEIQRLAISCPPGHGKSTLLNNFVAWFVGRDPSRRVLAVSASESLAKRNSRDAQALVTCERYPFNVSLATESVLEWNLSPGRGSVRAIGKGGVISGFRAELILCDDLQADAGSDLTRMSDFEWFQGVISTRLEPDGVCVIIQTRWHDADLIGMLSESESAGQWEFINLPAFAGEQDLLSRVPGTALWPERWPAKKLEMRRAEVGSGTFSALYQGDPVPAGGGIFKREWFEHTYDVLPAHCAVDRPPQLSAEQRILRDLVNSPLEAATPLPLIKIQAADSAWKTGVTNDRSALVTLASDGRDIYVTDLWYGRAALPDLRRIVCEQYWKHKPSRLYVEEAASGFALVQDLKSATNIPIIGVPPGREAKQARWESVTGLFESGRIKFPKHAVWFPELLNEFLRAGHGRHDDIVDAVVLGIRCMNDMLARVRSEQFWDDQLSKLNNWIAR